MFFLCYIFNEAGEQHTPKDVEEVVNYIKAMNHGLSQIRTGDLPLSASSAKSTAN